MWDDACKTCKVIFCSYLSASALSAIESKWKSTKSIICSFSTQHKFLECIWMSVKKWHWHRHRLRHLVTSHTSPHHISSITRLQVVWHHFTSQNHHHSDSFMIYDWITFIISTYSMSSVVILFISYNHASQFAHDDALPADHWTQTTPAK